MRAHGKRSIDLLIGIPQSMCDAHDGAHHHFDLVLKKSSEDDRICF